MFNTCVVAQSSCSAMSEPLPQLSGGAHPSQMCLINLVCHGEGQLQRRAKLGTQCKDKAPDLQAAARRSPPRHKEKNHSGRWYDL